MPLNNQAVCIVGMPRSGTSLIAHAAKLAGVYLGDDSALKPAVPNMNDEGIFELEELFSLHLSILGTAGRRGWHSSDPLPDRWWDNAAGRTGRESLARLVTREFSGRPLWGWKNPHGTLLLPVWEELALDLGFSMRVVVVFRNPLDVVRSLARVWNLPVSQGLRLWFYYMLTVFETVDRHPCLFIQYDDFLEEPEAGAKRLAAFLGTSETDLPPQVRAIVRPGLRHSRSSLEELAAMADADVVALYQRCLARLDGLDMGTGAKPRRLIGSLEDYRKWSRLADLRHCDRQPICLDSVLAFVTDDGEEQVAYKMIPYAPGGSFDERYPLPAGGARSVAFCPYPGGGEHFFRCRIEQVETDGGRGGIEQKNPIQEKNGWDVFPAGCQAAYKLTGSFTDASYVRIQGRIEVASLTPS